MSVQRGIRYLEAFPGEFPIYGNAPMTTLFATPEVQMFFKAYSLIFSGAVSVIAGAVLWSHVVPSLFTRCGWPPRAKTGDLRDDVGHD